WENLSAITGGSWGVYAKCQQYLGG
ncbi:hypothetical protein A2U01_0061017, partial [Trifolium medium]|nr:hypothetical protein [Trifolium medium]